MINFSPRLMEGRFLVGASTFGQLQETAKKQKTLGVVAADGKLPVILARSAKERGYRVVALPITKEAQKNLAPYADVNIFVPPGQVRRNFDLMQQNGCDGVVFIGKIKKLTALKSLHTFDWFAIRELMQLRNLSDDAIQSRLAYLMDERGMPILTQSEFLRELFPEVGVISKRQPTPQEYVDVEFGMRIAKEVARLDIGQTVIVRNSMLIAVEGIEGTDEAIKRAVKLAGGPVVVCKAAKVGHDQRFDIPTVGVRTLQSMKCFGGGGVLALGAHETMIVDREEMITHAEKNGISIVAV